MSSKKKIDRLRELIGQDHLERALPAMLDLSRDKDFQNKIRQLSGRLNHSEQERNLGLITHEDAIVIRNQVRYATLELLLQLEADKAGLDQSALIEQYYQMGNTQLKKQEYALAILYYDKVLALDRQHLRARIERGTSRSALQQFHEALADFTVAIELNDQNPYAYFNRGMVYYHLGEIGKACRDWQKVKSLGWHIADEYLAKACS